MIDARDPGTVQMPLAVKRPRGRPSKTDALSQAERAKRYRERKAGRVSELAARGFATPAQLAAKDREIALLVNERTTAWVEVDALREQVAALKRAAIERDVTKNSERVEMLQGDVLACYDMLRDAHTLWRQSIQSIPSNYKVRARWLDVWKGRGAQWGLLKNNL